VDDVIWQDVGLNDDDWEDPPRWLCDAEVRSGILAMLDLDRCEEEESRLRNERRAMQEWFSEEWDTVNAAHENTGALVYSYCYTLINCYPEDAGLRYQIGILKDSLCRLCALWQGSVHTLDISAMNEELDPWGPTEDEVLRADIAAVTAAWGNDPIEDDNDDEASVVSLDEEEDMDIGLINAPEAVDLADAYRHSGVGEDDDI
jgi:hypothetical protein